MFKIYDKNTHRIYEDKDFFYQWDVNRTLVVEDNYINEVHFCNKESAEAFVCETYTEDDLKLVNVPNILLTNCWQIEVYAFDGEATKHDQIFEVKARTKPSDYAYIETEVRTWNALKDTLEEEIGATEAELEEKIDNKKGYIEVVPTDYEYAYDWEDGIYFIKDLNYTEVYIDDNQVQVIDGVLIIKDCSYFFGDNPTRCFEFFGWDSSWLPVHFSGYTEWLENEEYWQATYENLYKEM